MDVILMSTPGACSTTGRKFPNLFGTRINRTLVWRRFPACARAHEYYTPREGDGAVVAIGLLGHQDAGGLTPSLLNNHMPTLPNCSRTTRAFEVNQFPGSATHHPRPTIPPGSSVCNPRPNPPFPLCHAATHPPFLNDGYRDEMTSWVYACFKIPFLCSLPLMYMYLT